MGSTVFTKHWDIPLGLMRDTQWKTRIGSTSDIFVFCISYSAQTIGGTGLMKNWFLSSVQPVEVWLLLDTSIPHQWRWMETFITILIQVVLLVLSLKSLQMVVLWSHHIEGDVDENIVMKTSSYGLALAGGFRDSVSINGITRSSAGQVDSFVSLYRGWGNWILVLNTN